LTTQSSPSDTLLKPSSPSPDLLRSLLLLSLMIFCESHRSRRLPLLRISSLTSSFCFIFPFPASRSGSPTGGEQASSPETCPPSLFSSHLVLVAFVVFSLPVDFSLSRSLLSPLPCSPFCCRFILFFSFGSSQGLLISSRSLNSFLYRMPSFFWLKRTHVA